MQKPVNNEALNNKPLQLLGMAKKAGLLAIGSEAVKSASRAGKLKLVIISSDTSAGSARQARYSAEDSKAKFMQTPYTKFDFGSITGRGSPGTLGFLDLGFAEGFMKRLADIECNRNEDTEGIPEGKTITQTTDNKPDQRRTNI